MEVTQINTEIYVVKPYTGKHHMENSISILLAQNMEITTTYNHFLTFAQILFPLWAYH